MTCSTFELKQCGRRASCHDSSTSANAAVEAMYKLQHLVNSTWCSIVPGIGSCQIWAWFLKAAAVVMISCSGGGSPAPRTSHVRRGMREFRQVYHNAIGQAHPVIFYYNAMFCLFARHPSAAITFQRINRAQAFENHLAAVLMPCASSHPQACTEHEAVWFLRAYHTAVGESPLPFESSAPNRVPPSFYGSKSLSRIFRRMFYQIK